MAKLDALVLNVFLDDLHYAVVFESILQLVFGELLTEAFNELRLDEHQNSADFAVSVFRD